MLAVLVIASLSALACYSYAQGGIAQDLFTGGLTTDKVDRLRAFLGSFGPMAGLFYVALVTMEVVIAPLPGLMLYAPGGVLFGGFWGGLLALIGNVLGAGLACWLARHLGRAWLTPLLADGPLAECEARLTRHGFWIILLLRLNPLTSSDLVSYAAGLTAVSTGTVMAATLVGMAPLCWAQAYFANGIVAAFPWLLYPLLCLCVLYVIVVAWVLVGLGYRCRRA